MSGKPDQIYVWPTKGRINGGWFYRLWHHKRYFWEARHSGFHLTMGAALTQRGARKQAARALAEEDE